MTRFVHPAFPPMESLPLVASQNIRGKNGSEGGIRGKGVVGGRRKQIKMIGRKEGEGQMRGRKKGKKGGHCC